MNKLKLTQNWNEDGSSDKFETLIVELQYALQDAPNVESFHWIFDDFGEFTMGVAVKLTTGERTFYTIYEEDTVSFATDGSLVIKAE